MAGMIEFIYKDSSKEAFTVLSGDRINDWARGGNVKGAMTIPVSKPNPRRSDASLYATWFKNPSPDVEVSRIVFHAADEEGNKAIWLVIAAAASSGENLLNAGKAAPKLALAGLLAEKFRFVLKKNFENCLDKTHPDGIRIENYCDIPTRWAMR